MLSYEHRQCCSTRPRCGCFEDYNVSPPVITLGTSESHHLKAHCYGTLLKAFRFDIFSELSTVSTMLNSSNTYSVSYSVNARSLMRGRKAD